MRAILILILNLSISYLEIWPLEKEEMKYQTTAPLQSYQLLHSVSLYRGEIREDNENVHFNRCDLLTAVTSRSKISLLFIDV